MRFVGMLLGVIGLAGVLYAVGMAPAQADGGDWTPTPPYSDASVDSYTPIATADLSGVDAAVHPVPVAPSPSSDPPSVPVPATADAVPTTVSTTPLPAEQPLSPVVTVAGDLATAPADLPATPPAISSAPDQVGTTPALAPTSVIGQTAVTATVSHPAPDVAPVDPASAVPAIDPAPAVPRIDPVPAATASEATLPVAHAGITPTSITAPEAVTPPTAAPSPDAPPTVTYPDAAAGDPPPISHGTLPAEAVSPAGSSDPTTDLVASTAAIPSPHPAASPVVAEDQVRVARSASEPPQPPLSASDVSTPAASAEEPSPPPSVSRYLADKASDVMRHEAQRFGTAVDAVVHAKNNAVEAATHPTHIPSIIVDNAKAFFVDDVAGTAVSAATGVYDSVRSVYDGVTTKGLKGYLNESVGTIPHFGQVSRGASLGATLPIELLGLAYGGEGAGGAVGTAARELPGVTGRSISDAERAATEGAAASMPPTTRDAQTTRAAEAVQDIAPQEKYGGCQSCQRAHERVEDNSAARGADSRSGSDAAFLRMLTRQLRAPIPDDVVHYGPHATGIGITPNIPRDVAESRGRSGLHDVFVHGDETGLPTIAAEYRNPFLIAQKIRENPSYEEGQGIRLFQCYGERSCATGLRAALGVDVLASRAAVGTVNGRLAVGGGNADAAEIARINEIEYRASREFTDRQRHNFLSTSAPSTR